MPKKSLNKNKAETSVVRGTVTAKQKEVIQGLIGVLGSNEQDVVSKIITLWLFNEGFLKRKPGDGGER
jgi:hypothetical protein